MQRPRPGAARGGAALAVLLALLAIPFAPSASGAEVRVQGSLDPSTVGAGETAVLTITVEGAASIDRIEDWSVPDGVRVRSGGESRNISLINGRMSKSIQKQYAVTALRAGSYRLGPIRVRAGGKDFQVGPFALEASAAQRPAPQNRPGAGGSGGGESGARAGAPAVMVEMSVEPATLTVGEQALLRVRFLRRADATVLDAQFVPPEMEGIWKEDLPPERRSTTARDGFAFEATDIVYAIFPTRPGSIEISPATVNVQYRDPSLRGRVDPFGFFSFGGREMEQELRSNPVSIQVKPLPQPSPAGFTGAVGTYALTSRLDRDAGKQGEPLTWTFEIRGNGNLAAVEAPPFPTVVGCRGFDGDSHVDITRANDRIAGTKTFSRVLVPEAAGALSLPPITWSYFDPEKERYVTIDVPAARLDVSAAPVATGEQFKGRIGGDLRGPRPVKNLHTLARERPWTQAGFWVLQVLPLVGLAVAYGIRKRRELAASDPVGARMRGAPARLRKRLREASSGGADRWGDLARAIEDYLADRFGQETRGMMRDSLETHLCERGLPESAVRSMVDLLRQSDVRRYAPSTESQEQQLAAAIETAVSCAAAMERSRG